MKEEKTIFTEKSSLSKKKKKERNCLRWDLYLKKKKKLILH